MDAIRDQLKDRDGLVRPRAQKEATMASKTTKSAPVKTNLGTLSAAERTALAKRVAKLRTDGIAWDGENGICEQLGIAGAPVGRKLLRELGWDTGKGIRASYDREAAKAKREAAKPKAKPASGRRARSRKAVAK